jgi:hypothetical protein
MKRFFPQLDQGLCWWALPKSPTGTEWHPIKVAEAFQETVDIGMPMMYWQGSISSAAITYLYRSLNIWKDFWTKPLKPIGRSYNGDGGQANAESIIAFADEIMSLRAGGTGILGLSWYSLDKAYKNSDWMAALASTEKFDILDPINLSPEEMLERLVRAHPDLFPELDL